MQAAIASLLDLSLSEVPNFIDMGEDWFEQYVQFLQQHNCDFEGTLYNPRNLGYWGEDDLVKLQTMDGVNGFFFASVYSPKYFNPATFTEPDTRRVTHAVIIDKDLNIVHDPNPAYSGIKQYPLHEFLGYNGVQHVHMIEKRKLKNDE
jgi:hypothetical protein